MKKRRRHFGDRKDGRRIRTLPPMSYVIPYIMRTRNDAQNFITDSIDITETDKYLREMLPERHAEHQRFTYISCRIHSCNRYAPWNQPFLFRPENFSPQHDRI